MTGATTALTETRRRDSATRRQRVISAVSKLAANGDDLSVSSVARAARVHRSFIYRHGDLHAAVLTQAAQDTTPSDGSRAGRQSLQVDLANALDRGKRQTQRISQLEKRLSQLLGERAWRKAVSASTPTSISTTKGHKTGTTTRDVTAQLAARDDDIDAARTANRELMAQLNRYKP